MDERTGTQRVAAIHDFRRLRRQATMESLLARLTGGSADLLAFEDVRQKLRATAVSDRQLREIPLDAIVGSVGRYQDFTRSFLPRQDSDEGRWARVMMASNDLAGLPPIEVYQIGDAYFVLDGNHRVSVARKNGVTRIQAYVTPFRTRVPVGPGMRPDDLIIAAEYASFLEATRLDESRPGVDLRTTAPGQYQLLREHIYVHGYYMELGQNRHVGFEEAAADWHDAVYLPAVELIRQRGLLRDFPGRTETDLYLWLAEHRAELEQQLGWEISAEAAAEDLSSRAEPRLRQPADESQLEMALSTERDPPPAAAPWRRDLERRGDAWLFDEILVPISGEAAGWEALAQAISIAHAERSRLYGLHVVRSAEQREGAAVQSLRAEFDRRCAEAGVSGRLAVEVGSVSSAIRDRSRWVDLVVLQISYPPGPGPLDRLKSGLHTLIRTSIRPVLTVPRAIPTISHLLLAYDGSPKATEALTLTAYLAGRWKRGLTVLTVAETAMAAETMRIGARAYLERHGVNAAFVTGRGPVGPAIIAAAEDTASDLIVIGGYALGTVGGLMLGSAVEEVLRTRRMPTLICQ
ncbi:universal stress protein [Oscillochloris sp. ZM17-4]|uniref:universal stress protein n=1 Tax=Oscillochloris sp. ZM17-4 TaxID=2866714 RepID=UPI001C72FE97|nr:universal stress protein [Oscillochloris sp. ZM17-4]MBX0329545.1 universal stress protein [Oscillochloris sp. ZM17-4]